ncbi:LysM peptidoglycan-binding domain-containing protein [Chryseobacterium sp. MYb264]|uniref:lytic transglycosylase n=1 Tax=Chryseobacterium sp. MYb264 TaxID=2745153 RepID=UPI002E12A607|nr:LysM peptidoglycan-binding domain-containing protein [Chryseobacterium sp. MYb264]
MTKRFLTTCIVLLYGIVSAQTTHTAVKGDNMYSIAKQYGTSVNDLLKLNPRFQERQLQVGDVLKLNNKGKDIVQGRSTIASQFSNITLKSTVKCSDIMKDYHISEKDLRVLNPDLDAQLKPGGKIVLPNENIVEYEVAMQKAWEKGMAKAKKESENKKNDHQISLAKIILNRNQVIKNIASHYNISESELKELNPDLESKIKVEGEIILPIEKIKNTKESRLTF